MRRMWAWTVLTVVLAATAAMASPHAPALLPARSHTRPRVGPLKAEVERLYADWKAGRVDRALPRLSEALRSSVTADMVAAVLEAERARMGDYVGIEGGTLREGASDEGRPVAVLKVTVRHARATTPALYAFVEEGRTWRLRSWGPRAELPDEATLLPAARALLDQVAREGALTLMARFPRETLEQEGGEAAFRSQFTTVAAIYGSLRDYDLPPPAFVTLACRQFNAPARFEHIEGAITFQLCNDTGEWMLNNIDIAPRTVTGPTVERIFVVKMRELTGRDYTVSCPPVAVEVGAEVTCQMAGGGEKRTVRLRRAGGTRLDIVSTGSE
jgi:hypothetical protein